MKNIVKFFSDHMKWFLLLLAFFVSSSFAQSIENMMFQFELLDRLERIEGAISGNPKPQIYLANPNFRSVGYLKDNAGLIEVDVANIRKEGQDIFTSTIRLNYENDNRLTKSTKKKYKTLTIGTVFICGNDDFAGIQPSTMTWFDKNGQQVDSYYGRLQEIKKDKLTSPFVAPYNYICQKR